MENQTEKQGESEKRGIMEGVKELKLNHHNADAA